MEQFSEAGFGIIDHGPNVPTFPIHSSRAPRLKTTTTPSAGTYLADPPSMSSSRREAFLELGGFSGKRMVGDFEMWHLLSQQNSLVVIPNGLAYYRKHDDQEMTVHAKDPIWAFRYFLISRAQLTDDRNPMSESLRRKHLFTLERKMARTILTSIKNHGLQKANEMRREAAWTWTKVWKSAFS